METPFPSDLGGSSNTSPFRVSVANVGEIWCQVAFPARFRSRRASWNGPWSSDRCAAFARRRVHAAGSRTGPRGQPRPVRTTHSQCARRRRLSLLVVWPRDNIAQATNLATFLRAFIVASCFETGQVLRSATSQYVPQGLGPLVGFQGDAAVRATEAMC